MPLTVQDPHLEFAATSTDIFSTNFDHWNDELVPQDLMELVNDPWIIQCLESASLPTVELLPLVVSPNGSTLQVPREVMKDSVAASATTRRGISEAQTAYRSPCSCLDIVLSLIEAITIEDDQASLANVPRSLRLYKSSLLQSKGLLECSSCTSKDRVLMLLVVLSRTLVTAYERVVVILTQQYERLHPNGGQSDHATIRHNIQACHKLVVREYELEAEEEPCVFGGLVTLQLGTLTFFFARLKALLLAMGCEANVQVLQTVWSRAKAQLRYCTSRCAEDAA
ncbi:hypothetical protein BP6252_01867 [Coleophoma cylindrospora]|uniref:Aflatoxin regulatory protein domain-containing protein n=1 Tax=Coleophoma cylindrospora TaxID=1849047 RepID=A0A3D8SD57_9HELO|nr:hypothetical protein BP6252_01867 [Coleophoma cylindrospora]